MDVDVEKIAGALPENAKKCLLAYTREHDKGYLSGGVYFARGCNPYAFRIADLLAVHNGAEALWECNEDRDGYCLYRPAPLGLAVRAYLMEKAHD